MRGKGSLSATIAAVPDYGAVRATLQNVPPEDSWPGMWAPCRAAEVLACPHVLLPLAALQSAEDEAEHATLSAMVADPLRSDGGGVPLQVRSAVYVPAGARLAASGSTRFSQQRCAVCAYVVS